MSRVTRAAVVGAPPPLLLSVRSSLAWGAPSYANNPRWAVGLLPRTHPHNQRRAPVFDHAPLRSFTIASAPASVPYSSRRRVMRAGWSACVRFAVCPFLRSRTAAHPRPAQRFALLAACSRFSAAVGVPPPRRRSFPTAWRRRGRYLPPPCCKAIAFYCFLSSARVVASVCLRLSSPHNKQPKRAPRAESVARKIPKTHTP